MTTPHKHAEVLRAIADGKEVQYQCQGEENWKDAKNPFNNPITYPEYDWRVKPEPKPDFLTRRYIGIDAHHYFFVDPMAEANVIFTFDGETRKLKKVEVIE